jgi:hypothetical protein
MRWKETAVLEETLALIAQLRGIYALELDASSSHRLRDRKRA